MSVVGSLSYVRLSKQLLAATLFDFLLKTSSIVVFSNLFRTKIFFLRYQVVIAQWLARRLATGEVLGSNPGKSVNLLISD